MEIDILFFKRKILQYVNMFPLYNNNIRLLKIYEKRQIFYHHMVK